MVKIAIAGASSKLAREILDKLVETGKHEIIALVRKDPAQVPALPGVKWVRTTYEDEAELVQLLEGVHTVLCFFVVHLDVNNQAQKRLIKAAVKAGVRRYAPAEWSAGLKMETAVDVWPFYAGKAEVGHYLEELNKEKKVLEYCRFQCGMYLDSLGYPHATTRHVRAAAVYFNFETMHATGIEGTAAEDSVSYTAISDVANIVARAIEFEGEWPAIGGIRGNQASFSDILELGPRIRGKPFEVDWLKLEDLEAGRVEGQGALTQETVRTFSPVVLRGTLLAIHRGMWTVSDEWNQIFPDYEFTQVDDYLRQFWPGA